MMDTVDTKQLMSNLEYVYGPRFQALKDNFTTVEAMDAGVSSIMEDVRENIEAQTSYHLSSPFVINLQILFLFEQIHKELAIMQ
jgi:hypothetical protein